VSAEQPFRVLPRVTEENAHFWRGGEQGQLQFLRCSACRTWIHPTSPRCPECLGKGLVVESASGRATVLTYTFNHQPWVPSADHPYPIAIVELEEQTGLRLMTNLVNLSNEDVAIGLAVRVVFEQREDVWFPLFEPADAALRRVGADPA
jgi:hypothetical protein